MYRHGLPSHPSCCTPVLARYYVACNGNLHPLYVNMPLSLMRAGSWRLCRSVVPRNCCIRKVLPVLLHPEVLPLPPSQVCCPYRYWGVSSSHPRRVFACYCGVGSSSSSAITSSSTCVERCYLTSTQGVMWLTCIIRVSLSSQLDICGSWWSCPRKCCLRKVLPVPPSHVLSSPSSGSGMPSCCAWLVSSSCHYYLLAERRRL